MQYPFDEKEFLRNLTHQSGVYLFKNSKAQILYVGKAVDLKNRLSSYFQNNLPIKTTRLMQQVADCEVTVTDTQTQALILEANLIKQHRPRYNILFKDDKTYPYLFLSSTHDYPRLVITRQRALPGEYFGPYPNAYHAKQSLQFLQKHFLIRSCDDSYFANRSRACLQYQIKRCSGPCVAHISQVEYQKSIEQVQLFLSGKSNTLIEQLTEEMMAASEQKNYEQAARVRDRIRGLKALQAEQYLLARPQNTDTWSVVVQAEYAALSVVIVRGGRCLGAKSFISSRRLEQAEAEVMSEFLLQYYLSRKRQGDWPEIIVLDKLLDNISLLKEVLVEHKQGKLKIKTNVRGVRASWVKMAKANALTRLQTQLNSSANLTLRFEQLNETLPTDALVKRIECFDISHTMGQDTVASCVVFDETGAVKSDYRRYTITDITPGDDYAAMKLALHKRYRNHQDKQGRLPDLILIDGGKGQLSMAQQVLNELGLAICILGIAKGPKREAGKETLWWVQNEYRLEFELAQTPRLLLQQVRDEAHRFAITGHKQRRNKTQQQSILEDIPGIGAKKRQSLLKHFGGLQGVKNASTEELTGVEGINQKLAELVYNALHK